MENYSFCDVVTGSQFAKVCDDISQKKSEEANVSLISQNLNLSREITKYNI